MWQQQGKCLTKEFTFPDFKTALDFVNKVGAAAETANHHPDIELQWGKVKISLMSHDVGQVTSRDYQLAEAIDRL